MITYYILHDTDAHMRVYNDRMYAEIWAVPKGTPDELTHVATWETVGMTEKQIFARAKKELHICGLVKENGTPRWGTQIPCNTVAYGTFKNSHTPNIVVVNRDFKTVELITFPNHGTAKMRLGVWLTDAHTVYESYILLAKNRLLQHMRVSNPAITNLKYTPL